nr:MAG TPA: hypothetical protein [Bacteriophage sp.]
MSNTFLNFLSNLNQWATVYPYATNLCKILFHIDFIHTNTCYIDNRICGMQYIVIISI